MAWVWLGLSVCSLAFWILWALSPARSFLTVAVGAKGPRARLETAMWGSRAVLEGRWLGGGGAGGAPGLGAVEIRLRLQVLHFLRLEKRFPVVSISLEGGSPVVWMAERWWAGAGPGREGEGRGAQLYGARRGPSRIRAAGVVRRAGLWAKAGQRGSRLLRRHLMVRRGRARLTFGLGDAAATAWAAGGVWSLWGGGVPWLCRRLHFETPPAFTVRPVFGARCFRFRLGADAAIRQGWLLAAGLLTLGAYGRTWLQARTARR